MAGGTRRAPQGKRPAERHGVARGGTDGTTRHGRRKQRGGMNRRGATGRPQEAFMLATSETASALPDMKISVRQVFGIDTDLNTAISFAGGLTLRLLAIWGGWKLPTFSYQQRWD